MYSNNIPFKEGALLYDDPEYSKNMALIYQRYKKFDQASYSLPNATFYNIFGLRSIRTGRFKRPLSTDIILCITDPLTYSEIKRYLTSFNLFKYFYNLFLQQKRKRHYLLNLKDINFINNIIYLIEYGRLSTVPFPSYQPLIIPTLPCPPIHSGTSGLRVPMNIANSQYFLENLFQSIVTVISRLNPNRKIQVLIGGDGRVLNTLAIEVFLRIAAGNQVQQVLIPPNGILSTPSAAAILQMNSEIDLGIILTASHNPGGVFGSFGVKLNLRGGYPASDALWDEITTEFKILKEVKIMPERPLWSGNAPMEVFERRIQNPFFKSSSNNNNNDLLKLSSLKEISKPYLQPISHPSSKKMKKLIYGNTQIIEYDSILPYIKFLKSCFNFNLLKKFINETDLNIIFDCAHGAANPYIITICNELNIDYNNILRLQHLDDFGGTKPDPNVATAKLMTSLFDVKLMNVDSLMQLADEYHKDAMRYVQSLSNDTIEMSFMREEEKNVEVVSQDEVEDFVPDIGFAFDADVDRCMVCLS